MNMNTCTGKAKRETVVVISRARGEDRNKRTQGQKFGKC